MRIAVNRRLPKMVVRIILTAASIGLAACDPPPPDELLLGAAPAEAFEIESVEPAEAPVPADGTIVVRFSSDIDSRSVSARSLRLARSGGRRPLRVRVASSGRELRVTPLPGHTFPAGETIALQLDGAPSPRAVRSAAGNALAHPFQARFRTGPAIGDFVGPSLTASIPRDGAEDVAPGSSIELHFSEPLARGAVGTGDAAGLLVDGVAYAARLELSGDRKTIVVRPATPLPPDRRVELALRSSLLDAAGNPLHETSQRRVSFRTRATSLHELAEDFVDSARCDAGATSCGWDDPETPGLLLARCGPVLAAPELNDVRLALSPSPTVHFQMLLAGMDLPDGLATALRIEFDHAPEGAHVRAALVEAGPTWLAQREPSFVGNRAATELRTLARLMEPVAIESTEGTRPYVDIVFEEPLRLAAGRSVLLDVRLDVSAGARVAACRDAGLCALVEGESGVAPIAALLVSPASPQARSLWYDAGTSPPGWQPATIVRAHDDAGVTVIAEFQCAPPDADGRPDVLRASAWENDLSRLPALRFVRFRVRFEGTPETGAPPRLDRIVLPYER